MPLAHLSCLCALWCFFLSFAKVSNHLPPGCKGHGVLWLIFAIAFAVFLHAVHKPCLVEAPGSIGTTVIWDPGVALDNAAGV